MRSERDQGCMLGRQQGEEKSRDGLDEVRVGNAHDRHVGEVSTTAAADITGV